MRNKRRKAMIFAAGLGTRLMPLTATKPKALVEVNGTPLLGIIIRKLVKAGFNDIIINIHHFAEQIIEFCNKYPQDDCTLTLSDERGQLLDTGGGLLKAKYFFNDPCPFLVHNVDILSDIDLDDLYRYHIQNKGLATLAIQQKNSSRVLLFDEKKRLCGWANLEKNIIRLRHKTIDEVKPWGFSGIHVIDPKIFSFITRTGIFSIMDAYLDICSKHPIIGYDHTGVRWTDVGSKEKLIEANQNGF